MTKATVGSRELKTRLGTYLRQVQQGRRLIVTERGRPVAELQPIAVEGPGEESRLDELVALGILSRRSKVPLARRKPLRNKVVQLSAAVIEDREDRS